MRSGLAGAIVASGLLLTATACSDSGSREVIYAAEYPNYESVDGLWDQADLVVEGDIGEPRVELLNIRLPGSSEVDVEVGHEVCEERGVKYCDVYTVVEVEVIKVWKGPVATGDIVPVKQLGGGYDNVQYIMEGHVDLIPGARYLLFLAAYPEAPHIPANLLNPQQAQYLLDTEGSPTSLRANDIMISIESLERLAGE